MPDPSTFDLLLRHATSAADPVAMRPHRTEADRTRAVIKRALQCLIDNNLITVVPPEDWPGYVYLDGKPPLGLSFTGEEVEGG